MTTPQDDNEFAFIPNPEMLPGGERDLFPRERRIWTSTATGESAGAEVPNPEMLPCAESWSDLQPLEADDAAAATAPTTITIDGRVLPYADDRNLLEAIRRAGIDLPTFCYHSELSVHGACRLCVVEVAGRGVVASCHTPVEPGMVVRTVTPQVRRMRRTTVELLLADHDSHCATCERADDCRLQDLAHRTGVERVRPLFGQAGRASSPPAPDRSSPAVHREPGKCVLCGDCVRVCDEVQGIGALDFAHRGLATVVQPAFGHGLGEGDCVGCGQCAAVCPTGALVPASAMEAAWDVLGDPARTVVVQIAPAVRVALAEELGLPPDADALGILCAGLRHLGAAAVYDTAFAADLVAWEEAHELRARLEGAGPLPMFTSCCPAWVAWVERFAPDLIPHLSSCRSPQQAFAALLRRDLPERLGIAAERLTVLAIMPCTAKKAEAVRPELAHHHGQRDVDAVLTTREAARLIRGAGLDPLRLAPVPLDAPYAEHSGAGLGFGAGGGVAAAVLRCAATAFGDGQEPRRSTSPVGIRLAARVGDTSWRALAVESLANAAKAVALVRHGVLDAEVLEVMACPGGCVGGAGQPRGGNAHDSATTRTRQRAGDLAERCAALPLRDAAANATLRATYSRLLGEPGGSAAHHLLHTTFHPHRRLDGFSAPAPAERLVVTVCLGTSCHLRGGAGLAERLPAALAARGWAERVEVRASFCLEACGDGPNAMVGDRPVTGATLERVLAAVATALDGTAAPACGERRSCSEGGAR